MTATDPRWSIPHREPAPGPEAWLAAYPRSVEAGVPVAALHAQDALRPSAGIGERLDALEGVLEALHVEAVPHPEALAKALRDLLGALGAFASMEPIERVVALGREALDAHRRELARLEALDAERARLARALAPPDLTPEEADRALALGRITPGRGSRHAHLAVRRAPDLVALLVSIWAECPVEKRPSSVLLGAALERAADGYRVDWTEPLLWLIRGCQTATIEARGAAELAKLVDKYQRHLDKLTSAFEGELVAALALHAEHSAERAAAADAVAEEIARARTAMRRLEHTRPDPAPAEETDR